jgi:ATPase complex subunit ATP10
MYVHPCLPLRKAGVALIRQRALYFPDISGKSLKGEVTHTTDLLKGKVSLLSIVSARISEVCILSAGPFCHFGRMLEPIADQQEHVHSFTAPLLPDWPNSPIFQHVQINHQANSLKSMLLSLFLSGLKRSVAEKDWGRYIVSGGAWSHFDVGHHPLYLM